MNTSSGNHTELKKAAELALLGAGQPLDLRTLKRVLECDSKSLTQALTELQQDWSDRALQLVQSAGGYQFISREEYSGIIRRLSPERPPRLSRSLLEVLAIIAYRQPVTRGDIEQIRGIAVSSNQIAFLEEQGWIEEVGRRETPGRPLLYATTNIFLDDLALNSLNQLPPLPAVEDDNLETDAETTAADTSDDETPPA